MKELFNCYANNDQPSGCTRDDMSKLVRNLKTMLRDVGLKDGDTVFVHSGVGALTALTGGAPASLPEAIEALHEALWTVIGEDGTIAAPGFFYDYARKSKPFDVDRSPPDRMLGFYPPHLMKQQGCRRSLNPIASILAVGKNADTICAHTSAHAFGITSPWARMVELDTKSLVIGIPFMMTFIHHIEALVGPPHVYNKIFRTPVIAGGKAIDLPVIASVRYLDYDIHYKNGPVDELRAADVLTEVVEGGVNCQLISFRDALRVIGDGLARDSNFTLLRPPKYVAGQVPDDGPARE